MTIREEELRQTINSAYRELEEIRIERLKKEAINFKPKYYKFKNSFGGEFESWNMFIFVKEQNDRGEHIVFRFEKDCFGNISLRNEKENCKYSEQTGYIQISKEEYEEALSNIFQDVEYYILEAQENTPSDKRVAVVAGNIREFEYTIKNHNLDRKKFFYVSSVEKLRGLHNLEYMLIGSYYDRKDFHTLLRVFKENEFRVNLNYLCGDKNDFRSC